MNRRNKLYKEIIELSAVHRKNNKHIGLITGSFDILHPGHVHFIQQAKKQCDVLIVGVENDTNIKRTKGTLRPIHTQDQRIEVLAELRSIDYLFKIEKEFPVFNQEAEEFYSQMLQEIHPNFLFTTTNKDAHFKQKKIKAEQVGVVLVGIDVKHDTSTTNLADKILKEF